MTKSWRSDDFAPEAERFYRDVERQFSIEIYHPIEEVRFCLNADDAKRAKRRLRNTRYANVLKAFSPAGENHPAIYDLHGSFRIIGAAYVDLPRFVQTLQEYFKANDCLFDEAFDYSELKQDGERWDYKGETYERVIFCEGATLKQNPWFGHLPITPAKGETLLCDCEDLALPRQLLHHQKWLLPYPDGSFRIGATFDEDDLSEGPTDSGMRQLLEGFHALTTESHEPKVIKHLAGIRPSTHDARPFLGRHHKHAGLYLMNGLGSKGASLAPTLSRELTEHIFEGTTIDPETDINRFLPSNL